MEKTYQSTLKGLGALAVAVLAPGCDYNDSSKVYLEGVPRCLEVDEVSVINSRTGRPTTGDIQRLDLTNVADEIEEAMQIRSNKYGEVKSSLLTIMGEKIPYSIVKDPLLLPREELMLYREGDRTLRDLEEFFNGYGTVRLKVDPSECYNSDN